MISFLSASARMTPSSAASGSSKERIRSSAASLAPPCSGPRSVPMAAVIAEWKSVRVEAAVRAAKVEALNSCSAYRVMATSRVRSASGVTGPAPSCTRVWAASDPAPAPSAAAPRHAPMTAGNCASRVSAASTMAAGSTTGATAPSAEQPVRSTSIGWA